MANEAAESFPTEQKISNDSGSLINLEGVGLNQGYL